MRCIYHMIYDQFWCTLMIQNFVYTIGYISYSAYCISYDIDNYGYYSITIRCAKCQIFGIWHTKHQKTLLMRCSKSNKFWHTWTVPFHFWNGMDRCAKFFFYSTFSLSSHNLSLSNLCSLSLSSLDQIPSPSLIPHRSSHCHRIWFEDCIIADLKPPSSPV